MAKPNLEKIEKRMKKGIDFELSRSQYLLTTGADLPQNSHTLKIDLLSQSSLINLDSRL